MAELGGRSAEVGDGAMSMFIIRVSVRYLARRAIADDWCWTCVKPRWCCDCKDKR